MSQVAKIRNAGFTLEIDGGDLIVEPFSKLTDSQWEFLKTHKAEIIQDLKRELATNDGSPNDYPDDRHHCCECRNLINARCIVQRFRPCDDHPRRCADYVGEAQP